MVAAYSAAFADEAVLCWVIPDPVQRAACARSMFRELLAGAVRTEQVILAELPDGTLAGISVWLHHRAQELERQAERLATATIGDDAVARRLAVVNETVLGHRPREPHVYLASIAVRPPLRGRGAGAAILAEGLRVADAAALPVYLEASTEQSRRLYLRHDFRDRGRPLALPAGGPVLWPMWRHPRPDHP
ncbi:GNAT family N-acetyltransferase [Micromonospora sp. C28SCA-DRY-2]|uniref:GNAT family N-acetyltransferase n=1 Tax=Micromonospora sp. C28SCA-DRY-2 TaxID=3059522 RepID=UPI002676CEAE|nr:GNAT family N-acetyltransferase [Micromonospora sp. C28SCA-DRY-2]MDO3700209.1 GNAT family N-acetyltransferase [Micromonospora sp. C28SCA-DRY-2]